MDTLDFYFVFQFVGTAAQLDRPQLAPATTYPKPHKDAEVITPMI